MKRKKITEDGFCTDVLQNVRTNPISYLNDRVQSLPSSFPLLNNMLHFEQFVH